MGGSWSRREFVGGAVGTAAALGLGGVGSFAETGSGLRGRFLTHVSVVRVNQIEVTPTKSIGEDESGDNSPARIRGRQEAFRRGAPSGKMTWAISWLALIDQRPGRFYRMLNHVIHRDRRMTELNSSCCDAGDIHQIID